MSSTVEHYRIAKKLKHCLHSEVKPRENRKGTGHHEGQKWFSNFGSGRIGKLE